MAAPSDADLVFEIQLLTEHEYYGDKLQLVPVLKLVILDPKTRIVLWTFNEELEKGGKGITLVGVTRTRSSRKQLLG